MNTTTRRPDRIPLYDNIMERYTRPLREALVTYLGQTCMVSIISIDSLTLSEFRNTLPVPSLYSIFESEALDESMACVYESKLAYALINAQLGGSHSPVFDCIDGKEFTAIESALLQRLHAISAKCLDHAFLKLVDLGIHYRDSDVFPDAMKICAGDEAVQVTTIEVKLIGLSGTIALVAPPSFLKPIESLLKEDLGSTKARASWHLRDRKLPDLAALLSSISDDHLFNIVVCEHPQCQSFLIGNLPIERAEAMIQRLPERFRTIVADQSKSSGLIRRSIGALVTRTLEDYIKRHNLAEPDYRAELKKTK
ncbi:hypothetical protein WDW37_19030 [Bdellovibrionota bacterium FG-1]